MNDNDFQRISQLLDEKLAVSGDKSDKKFDALNQQLAALETRSDKKFDALNQQLAALETRSDKKFDALEARSDKKLAALEERLKKHTTDSVQQLSHDVGDFIQENLIPMIEEKADKSDIDRLERKLDRVLDSSVDHESRIKAIEQIPVIAHELKLKKSK